MLFLSTFYLLTKSSIGHRAWVITPSRPRVKFRAKEKLEDRLKKSERTLFESFGIGIKRCFLNNIFSFNIKFYRPFRG